MKRFSCEIEVSLDEKDIELLSSGKIVDKKWGVLDVKILLARNQKTEEKSNSEKRRIS